MKAAGQQCDDGNVSGGDGCSATCTIESGWVCTGVPSTCHEIVCGDGIIDPPEGCDDGADTSDVLPDRCRSDCQPARCGDGVEDATEVCDWGPDNGTSNGCLANCAGYADYQFSNGADIALSAIPGAFAILASVTDAELQCIHTDPIDFEAYEARSVAVHSYDMVVGAVVVLAVDTVVDDPVIFYDNGEHFDGRTLVHERAPFVDVAPGSRLFKDQGVPIAMVPRRRLPMTIVRLHDFVVGPDLRCRMEDTVVDSLVGHRIVVEYWVEPLIDGHDSKERLDALTDWICAAAYAFVSGHATEAELREEGYVFRLYSPDGVTLLDTVTRTPPPY